MPKPPTTSLANLDRIVAEDAQSRHRRFPEIVAHAPIKDVSLREKLERHFAAGETLESIHSVGYNFFTGLNHTVFGFGQPQVSILGSGVLVITNSECQIVGMVDPFNWKQPNPRLPPIPEGTPPLPREGAQPFVLNKVSESERLVFTAAALYPTQLRSEEFFRRLGLDSGSAGSDTRCSWETTYKTLVGRSCKQLTGLLQLTCDADRGRDHNLNHHTMMILGKNVRPSVIGGIAAVGNDFGAMGFDSTSGEPSEAADVPANETLESAAKTLGGALGIDIDTLDQRILAGKVVTAAIQS